MSSMLDQAVVDAEALKEAALKSAETTMLEKYSNEIKEAVSTLLEQPVEEEGEEELGAEEAVPEPGEEEDVPPEDEDLLDDVPPAHSTGGLDSEIIDGVRTALADAEKALNDVENKVDELDVQVKAGTDGMLELDLDALRKGVGDEAEKMEGEPEEMVDREQLAGALPPGEEELEGLEENVEVSDEILNAIIEELTVDLHPHRSGWVGRPEAEARFNDEISLAREQDTKVKEENDALRAAMKKLQEKHSKAKSSLKKLQESNTKYKKDVLNLKSKLNEINTVNVRLFYSNQVLKSDSLNERQKNKIVEALSNADSVEETKVLYETLQSAVGQSQRREPKSLSEVVSRGSSTSLLPRKRERDVQNIDFSMRMKKLAGIT